MIKTTLTNKNIAEAIKVLKSKRITYTGKYTKLVEGDFSKLFNRYCLFVNSGSSANLLAISLLLNKFRMKRINIGDQILIPTICWSTSLYPIIQLGLDPVFVDVDPSTLNIDLKDLKSKITKKTKALFLVHALGNCSDMSKLNKIVKTNKLYLIEDTCEALGSKYKKKYLGTYGDISTFSFFYSHHITSGEGGLITCSKLEDYKILLSLRSHGWSREISDIENKKDKKFNSNFNFINLGYNLRSTDIQAALLRDQIKYIDKYRKNRMENYNTLSKLISDNKLLKKYISLPYYFKNTHPSWFGFAIILNKKISKHRNKIAEYLSSNSIQTRPIISGDFTKQKVIKKYLPKYFNSNKFEGSKEIDRLGFFITMGSNKYLIKEIKIISELILKYFKKINLNN